jgi:hypothetical protein
VEALALGCPGNSDERGPRMRAAVARLLMRSDMSALATRALAARLDTRRTQQVQRLGSDDEDACIKNLVAGRRGVHNLAIEVATWVASMWKCASSSGTNALLFSAPCPRPHRRARFGDELLGLNLPRTPTSGWRRAGATFRRPTYFR